MAFKRSTIILVVLILSFAIPYYARAANFFFTPFAQLGQDLLGLPSTEIEPSDIPGHSLSQIVVLAPEPVLEPENLEPENSAVLFEEPEVILAFMENLSEGSNLVGSSLVGASLAVGDWFSELRLKVINTFNSDSETSTVPSIPVTNTTAPAPNINPIAPSSPVSPGRPVTQVANTATPAAANSLLARVLGLENQIVFLRNLISKQSDRNVEQVTQVITETVNNTTVTESDFDTTVAHTWTGEQTLNALIAINSTTTGATTTDLYVSNIASTTNLYANVGNIGNLTVTSCSGCTAGGFAWPFTKLSSNEQSTSTAIVLVGGLIVPSAASSTLSSTTIDRLLITGSASSTNFFATNFLANGSSTFQALFSTSATGTNLYATNFLALGSSTFQALRATSATGTNLYATNFLALGSSTFQALRATSATSTNQYVTNLLALGSTTLIAFTGTNSTTSQSTTTNLFATTANFGAASTDIINFKSGTFNFLNRTTTTLQVLDTAWVIATNTAATAYPLMSFNNSAGTSTIQFFGATTTGLTAGTGMGIPTGQFVLIGDGKTPSGLNILKGGLCVDNDGWCTATTSGRISSVSTYLGGADIAEMYQASGHMEAGDVVSILNGINVSKANTENSNRMMGVVSTNPGIVLGTGPGGEGRPGDVPIALAGRVPVKVSTENGVIDAGDYLVLSTIPGVAAKALKPGNTIGQALEDYSSSGVSKINVFVKNSYYGGTSLDSFPGLTTSNLSTPEAILIALDTGTETGITTSPDLTVGRMLAAVEIITPKLTAGLISAKTIESPTIDALSNRITTEISTLKSQIDSHGAAITSLESRIRALENATSTISLENMTALVNNAISGAGEWVFNKITAALAVFTKLEVGTARVSTGIEMIDSATGEVYCITLKNNEWDKMLGECGTVPQAPAPAANNNVPEPINNNPPEAIIEESTTTPEVVDEGEVPDGTVEEESETVVEPSVGDETEAVEETVPEPETETASTEVGEI